MKIAMSANKPLVPFGGLQPGDVFMTADFAESFMIVSNSGELESCDYNAVELKSGELRRFGDMAKVVRVDAVLHVNF